MKILVLTLALVTVMLVCPGDCEASCCCPTFWTAYNSSCYRERNSVAHLVSIHSLDEHDFIVSYFRSTGIKDQGDDESTGRDMWVGLHDTNSEGNFEWTDRSSFNMNVWSPGQPDNAGSREHCGEIVGVYGYKWNDEQCDRVAQYFMCKLPAW
ncbi:echinoidin-like isoform X2 [Lytechinus pictus]|uniref:echinoidin-like isoform X2 n=1 Tax=Lytechinus pictus TaxID=7653 RepID=UPI0030B9B910